MSTDEANTQERHSHKRTGRTLYRCIGFYVAGWLLIYFGVVGALLDYGQTYKWRLNPDHHYLEDFFWAAVTLATPAFVGLLLLYAYIPLLALLVWLLELPQRWRS